MRTYPIQDDAGVLFAFEVRALLLCGRFASKLGRLPGVSDVRPRRRFAGSSDVHIRFLYRGRAFIVWEPYADNSRWWIGPEDSSPPHSSIAELERAVAGISAW